MKFGHSLTFNCVPEWSDYYISYDSLKRSIYSIQHALHHLQKHSKLTQQPAYIYKEEEERAALEGNEIINDLERFFMEAFERDLHKVARFYKRMELAMSASLQSYQQDCICEHKKLTELYIGLSNLKDFLQLNYTGFIKIIKKHEKYGWLHLKEKQERMLGGCIDLAKIEFINGLLYEIECLMCTGIGTENIEESGNYLKHHLRDHLVYERNIIWKEMVEQERKYYTTSIESNNQLKLFASGFKGNVSFLTKLACGIVIFWIGWVGLSGLQDDQSKVSIQCCFALTCFVIYLWCFELFPMFVTSLLIPLFASFLPIMQKDGLTTTPLESSNIIFHSMFSHVIMLLLGSFTIAAAISKYGISKRIAYKILRSLSQPTQEYLLFVMMGLSCFLSVFVSNVASPVLCYSIIQPILKSFESEDEFAKALILSICFGANIGGISSPISSPQNIFAIEEAWRDKMAISWIEWMKFSMPSCILSIVATWRLLVYLYGLDKKPKVHVTFPRWTIDEWNQSQVATIAVFTFTISTWIMHPFLKEYIGQIGTLAIVPIFIFFGCGFLSKDDFNSFPWHIVILSMCGLALGECIKVSGLLNLFATEFSFALLSFTHSVRIQLFVAAFLTMAISTVVSHTVCAIILLPIMHGIIHLIWQENPALCKLFIITCSFSCSLGIGLPFSSFPNLSATSLETATGQNYFKRHEFSKIAVVVSFLTTAISTIWCLLVYMISRK